MNRRFRVALSVLVYCIFAGAAAAFVHPGCLSTQADLDRMKAKIAAGQEPWKGSWDLLVANSHAQLSYTPNPQTSVCAGSVCSSENYMTLANDCAAAYQCALRYHISGDTQYADKAVEIMNAWSATLEGFSGDSNAGLRAGLYGYQFACAAELVRNYSGWAAADFTAFKNMMLTIFYPINSDFLVRHNNTCDSHYWANWDLANMASIIAIGVLCDDQAKFDEAVAYFYSGIGEGAVGNAVHYIHPDGTGQWQESGRDQGHNTLGPVLMGPICEIAWNQGIDLYGYANNRFLAGCEYIAKYNLWSDVPYVTYINCEYTVQSVISSSGRGNYRAGWDMIYNHYVNRMGVAAFAAKQYADQVRPEGGGGNYGSTSGGYDSLGFTTLTHALDPITSGTTPSGLLPYIKGRQITLSWWGSPLATIYNVKRSTTNGGPYTTIATIQGTSYIDPGLTAGTTYYYVVSANNPNGESANSAQVAATADGQLHGTVIGTEGSYNSAGAARGTVFDGSLKNFFDGPASVSWAGLDLGSGVTAVITQVKYCPRPGYSSRMVGGKFQGSNTADFSSGVTDLLTISTQPTDGVLTTRLISNSSSFRYVRYLSPSGSYGNVAEVQFFGTVSGLSIPATPVISNAKQLDGFKANLVWNAVSGATNYNVKRSAKRGGPYTIIAQGVFTSYSDTKLAANTSYYYVISALNSAGQSADSNEVCVTTQSSGKILTAQYKFDGDAADGSGNGYDAAETGSPAYAAGKFGQAVDFDGTDDLITLPSGVADYDDITIAAWVYWDGGSQWQRIFDFGTGTSQYLFLTPYSGSNTLRFAIKNGGSEQVVETSTLSSSQWIHLAVTLGGDTAKLYVNGVLKTTNTAVTINPSDFNPTVNYLGDSQWSADPLFSGSIDDFRVYNFALTSVQIAAAMADNTAPIFTANPILNLDAVELSSYTGISVASHVNDVDSLDTLTFNKVSGPDWLAVAKDGTLSGIPGNSDVGDNDFSVLVMDTGGFSDTAALHIQTADIYSGIAGVDDLLGLASHWLVEGCTDFPVCGGADLDSDADVDVEDFSVLAGNWMISEDLQLNLKLDDGQGTVAADDSTYGRSGTLTNGPLWSTDGKYGGALHFDGIDDYVMIPDYYGISGTGARTVCLWIKSTSAKVQELVQWGADATGQLWLMRIQANGTILVAVYGGGVYGTLTVNDGQWHSVTAVLEEKQNASPLIRLYIDGQLDTVSAVQCTIDTASVTPVHLGVWSCYYAGNKVNYFCGQMDDVRIYNRVLTAEEIAVLMP